MQQPLEATVSISVVRAFLAGVDRTTMAQFAERSGIAHELLSQPGARVTQEQFSTLYRLLAMELDDEMPGIFSRPLRNGLLKYLCLSLLDAGKLEVALNRFGQFFHLIVDDFRLQTRRDDQFGYVEMVIDPNGPPVSPLGRELMLKLVHGVASWLIWQKIPLAEVCFDFPKPAQAGDHLYLFPGPIRFGADGTRIAFDAALLDLPIRRRKSDLNTFLARAPEDWIFVSFGDQMMCHRVRQYIAGCLPEVPTVETVALELHHSVRTLCRRLAAEGTNFQSIKDEVRRDISIQKLIRSQDAIAEIAFDVGFDTPSAFHRAFRHWTGSTPNAYRTVT
ncbi:MAG TPA: AraC family transcriptional regulator [Paraburkholderia sp.]|jgi:AraC-like DNA-binding protein|nr:AraC family transcriptional regulator [Paraburkholderia sp.]